MQYQKTAYIRIKTLKLHDTKKFEQIQNQLSGSRKYVAPFEVYSIILC